MEIIYGVLNYIANTIMGILSFIFLILSYPLIVVMLPLQKKIDRWHKAVHFSYFDGWHDAVEGKESQYEKLLHEYEDGSDKFNYSKEFSKMVVIFWIWTIAVFVFGAWLL